MTKQAGERAQVALSEERLRLIDNYRHAARIDTRSEAVFRLAEIATGKRPMDSTEHKQALEIMAQFERLGMT